jgi:acetylornithine deacetylase/succinyl-diaminopimelate desuccinylase-like protein
MSDLDALTAAVAGLMPQVRADLAELVAIPSVADARQFDPVHCERAAHWVADALRELGFADVRLEPTPDGSHAVVGSLAGPESAPTVLLYSHYDVQPPLDEDAWASPPFELVDRDGRWYGRGSADCKGNLVMHLAALRALRQVDGGYPVSLKVVIEGSEEQGTGGLERWVEAHPDVVAADVIVIADAGNAALGVPTVTTSLRGMVTAIVRVDALSGVQHSGSYGGAAPDALAALIAMLATFRDADGRTTVRGLEDVADATWDGVDYPADRFRADVGVLDGVDLVGGGSVPDAVWARPALTVTGIDSAPAVGSANAIQPNATARLNLRIPPTTDVALAAKALVEHLHAVAPWHVRIEVDIEGTGSGFLASTGGPAYTAMGEAMRATYGVDLVTAGQGGSIPLCSVLQATYPEAEILLIGVEEPLSLIHAPNESVHPGEIERMAIVEADFLRRYAAAH